jgi:phage tail-like protein
MTEPALALRFKVVIDGFGTLGDWTKCDGISLEYDVFEYREGGQNGFVHRLPGRAKYQNIKLTRPIDRYSALVALWVGTTLGSFRRQTAEITVLDVAGDTVASWSLSGVYPAKWSGPSLDVGGNQVASETLELAHHGLRAGL